MSFAVFAAKSQTTEGTDFWFGFMENADAQATPVSLEVYISARNTANVQLSTQGNFSVNLQIEPGTTERIEVPLNFMPRDEGKFNLGIHVVSDEPVSVYQLNKRQFSADAAVILPVNALGKEYYVTAHMEPPSDIEPGSRESELLIVATEDNTEVEITPSSTTFGGWPAGEAQNITLDAGDTYLVKSEFDLSGTYVRTINTNDDDCKNVAVFGGNVFVNVGGCGGFRDHLIEQMFPVSTWGRNFVFVPYQTRSGGDYVKIIAAEDNTVVTIEGLGDISLDAGDVYRNKALSNVRLITSNNPISLAQFSRSGECDFADADPFMIMVSPVEQKVRQVTFSAFTVQEIDQFYLTLITDMNSLAAGVLLDGEDIRDEFTTTLNGYAYAEIEIARGDHTVDAPEGVIAYVYGYGTAESFGYSAGVNLANLNLEIQGDDEFIGEIITEACVGAEITFDASFDTDPGEDPRYDTFLWDYGDGNVGEDQVAVHTYSEPGVYTVTLTASQGNASCGNSETITREITIIETEVSEITGPVSVCPDVENISYSVEGPADNSYEWEVVGGNIISGQGTAEILVNWGAANNLASVKVTPFNGLGCRGEDVLLNVVINKRLEPAAPQSSSPTADEVCFLDRNRIRYFTPQTNGSEYEWFSDPPSVITTDPLNNEVIVDWGDFKEGKIWYREFNPIISDCEGFSDTLNVVIYPEILETAVVKDALCNGDANGSIVLTASGGKNDAYSVEWDNGMSGASISGLLAGDYTATITDALGCEITSRTYTVFEPDVLEFVNSGNILDVRCFQEANGEIAVDVIGGTAPYTYQWSGVDMVNVQSTAPVLAGLKTGVYEVMVTDANGCTAVLNDILVGEPPLLEPDLETLVNESICPEASNGVAFIDAKGGTPDYQFFWSNQPNENNRETGNLSKGEYTVRIVDANGCEAFYTILKEERDPKVSFPNSFSPNGDGLNDEFKAVTDCPVQFSLQVYNKWGTIVYSTTDITEGWDGRFEGGLVQDGRYSYVAFWSARINDVLIEQNIRGTINIFK